MNMLAILDAMETPLKPVLDPRVYVEPKDKNPSSELQRQGPWISFIRVHARGILAFAVPNGTHIASRWGRNKADREGRYTGFPDTGAAWSGTTAYLEWKDGQGKADPAQIECLNRLVAMGHPCAIVRTREGANRWLLSLGAPIPAREGRL
jgi:hypothetical protein